MIVLRLPLCVADTGNIKPIDRAAIDRRRSHSADRRKVIDVQTGPHQMIGHMKHNYFADIRPMLHACLGARSVFYFYGFSVSARFPATHRGYAFVRFAQCGFEFRNSRFGGRQSR